MDSLKAVLQALYNLRDDPNTCRGICNYLNERGLKSSWKFVQQSIYESWPRYSCNIVYPVPAPECMQELFEEGESYFASDEAQDLYDSYESAEEAAYEECENGHYFDRDTEYGAARWELLEHAIKWLEVRTCNTY